ncbi:hypothetical protein PO80_00035 [Vibrio parahaemolyticus]|uniref:hypothetical protein n=1 Tax=Vibrio parahaemolyticus TaxID=670 RepID=UPI000542EE64|nr:hypothetical protein [Vibrio parahaemolyticus]ELU8562338.1 hypothetical protein [Vibrio parahaemolyticus]KHF18223.1 hypothetical protein PO80_00035 [Vibrio parahaemolyticus]OTV98572.1 hypothetical protein BA739_21595 [Vibrio parahaemolyticus]OTW04649.1 hypothetical protein BA740_19545 [Vibrio parahaemolyticus]
MLRDTENIRAEYIRSFIDALNIIKVRHFYFCSKQSDIPNINGGVYNAERDILGEDSHLTTDTEGCNLEKLLDDKNTLQTKNHL